MSLNSVGIIALAIAGAAFLGLLGGCGFDDIQLNGKVFDAVGLNSTGSVKGEPKVAVRQPLVMPPGLESLPPPGSGKAEQPTLADIQDPDAKKKVSQSDLERQQAEYCKKNYDDALARGDASADSASGPLGSCHPSIFSAVKKWTSGTPASDDDDTQTQ